MPIYTVSFVHHQGLEILSVHLRGRAETGPLLEILAEIEHTARARSVRHLLADESDLELTLLSPNDIRTLVDAWTRSPTISGGFTAVLATRPVTYGINRMAQAFSDRAEGHLAVFRKREDALAWLRAR